MSTAIAIPGSERWAFEDVPYRKIREPTLHWSHSGSELEMNLGAVNVRFRSDDSQPRHRHTFDQVRYIISGSMTYGRGRTAVAGDCVYFPEGVPYGPISYEDGEFFLLQWRGPSENGVFIDYEELSAASRKICEGGGAFDTTKGGVFRHPDGRIQDGYEAVAEFVTGRPVTYSPPRYTDQIAVRSSMFPARDLEGCPGVRIKHLGYFNEVGPNVKLLQFDAGATLSAGTARSQQVWNVVSGVARYEGAEYAERSLLYVPPGAQRSAVEAQTTTEIVVVHLRPHGGPMMPFSEFP